MRKRNRFARVGLLSIALLLSLCVMGIGYAGWTDTASIGGTMQTGYIDVVLIPGSCSSSNISCSVIAPHTLHVTLTTAGPGTYTCDFAIDNIGTIPVKIQGIGRSSVPAGVQVSVLDVVEGTQIEQAGVSPDEVEGMVRVILPANGCMSFSFDVFFYFVQWNLY